MNANDDDKVKGVWRTVSGRHIFIKEGQNLTDAMRESGKFKKEDGKSGNVKVSKTKTDKSPSVSTEADKVLGKEYKGIKGQAAIKKLLAEKQGHIRNAFSRDDIGGITLMWGDDGSGLQHLINSREKQGITDVDDFVSNLTDVVENGRVVQINAKGRFEILKDGKMAVIAPQLRDGKITYLFTAYKTRKK